MPLSPELQEAVDTAKAGQLVEARSMLKQILRKDPTNEAAWFLYAQIADNKEHAIVCLKKVLEYNPYNERARQMLAKLQPEDILEKTASDKEWDYNRYMESQEKTQAAGQKKSKSGINPNLVIGILALVFIGLMAAAGFYFAPKLFPPKPTIAPIKAVNVSTPTPVDTCSCDAARPYAERSVLRFSEMVDEMDIIGDGLNDGSLTIETAIAATANAQARYDSQRGETPPACLEPFDAKIVNIFWSWQQALTSLQQGDNNAVIAFVNEIVLKASEIDTMLTDLDLQLKGCPMPRPAPPGQSG
jgi:tetratricopeptide (TPR) repeat protein